MVNYSLEDFKTWLEEKPERKATVCWPYASRNLDQDKLTKVVQGQIVSIADKAKETILEWKAEVDARERERERAIQGENMPNLDQELILKLIKQAVAGYASAFNRHLAEAELPPEVKNELAKLKELSEAKANFRQATEKLKAIEDRNQHLQKELREELRENERDLGKTQQELQQCQQQHTALTKELTTLKTAQEKLKQKETLLEREKEKLNGEKRVLESGLRNEKQITAREKRDKEQAEKKITELENLRKLALQGWEQKHTQLKVQLHELTAQKDTFQKSADYLRETLKSAEKTLEDIKQQLAQAQETSQKDKDNHQQALTNKEEELRQRNEAFKVISERNTDLQSKLSQSSSEIDQLSQWISKLESASVEGDAFTSLKQDLALAQTKIQELQEQLNLKQPQSYWWIYVVVALIGIYFIVK